jgi:hypothetical protein
MKLSVKTVDKDEDAYGLSISEKQEDTVVFSYGEYTRFYDKIEKLLDCIRKITPEKIQEEPVETLNELQTQIEAMEKELTRLLEFDAQTTLDPFETEEHEKTQKLDREPLQCLISL